MMEGFSGRLCSALFGFPAPIRVCKRLGGVDMLIRFDAPDVIELRNALYNFARKGVPHASRSALNAVAFEARKEWQRQIDDAMVLRNKWTTRSIRVVKARGTNVSRMESVVGSVATYMATQEDGGTIQRSGKHGVSIPTSVASGEGRGAQPRKRLVRRPNRLPNITLAPREGRSRAQRNAIAIRRAIASGRKYVFLDLEARQGIFRIAGGRRRPRLDLIWDLSRPTVRIPPTRTLARTLRTIEPRLAPVLRRALQEQLDRAARPVRDWVQTSG